MAGTTNPLEALTLDQLSRRRSMKWRQYPEDVLPLWVAEMDVDGDHEWWLQKIGGNQRRDEETSAHLTALGWRVLRFWEHEDASAVAEKVSCALRRDPN